MNTGKTKIMRYKKGGGRWKKMEWKWKGERLKKVKEFSYLGYKMSFNRKQEKHIKERVRKGGIARTGVGNRKEKIWRGVGKETMVV